MPGSASRRNRTDEFGGQKGSDCGPCRKEHSVKVACIGVGRATSHEALHHLKAALSFDPRHFPCRRTLWLLFFRRAGNFRRSCARPF